MRGVRRPRAPDRGQFWLELVTPWGTSATRWRLAHVPGGLGANVFCVTESGRPFKVRREKLEAWLREGLLRMVCTEARSRTYIRTPAGAAVLPFARPSPARQAVPGGPSGARGLGVATTPGVAPGGRGAP